MQLDRAQGPRGDVRDVFDVRAPHPYERVPGTGGGREVVAEEQPAQFGDGADAGVHALVVEGRLEIVRDRLRPDPPALAARQVKLALQVEVLRGRLLRSDLVDPVEDVVV